MRRLPKALPWQKLIGPSVIMLGLGLGSGEVILWPYLISNWGLGLVWGMVAGISMQFLINMEIERFSLVRGQNVFAAAAERSKWWPIWFLVSTIAGFGWPGIILASGSLLSAATGAGGGGVWAAGLLVGTGLIISLGKNYYKTLEGLMKVIILVGVPAVMGITLTVIRWEGVVSLGRGLMGLGEGYWGLPGGLVLGTFLGALAYSGAGGNLNMSQSFYVLQKGYGMGKYGNGSQAAGWENSKINRERFKRWWRAVNLEHGVVFWGMGRGAMLTLGLLAYSTVYGTTGNQEGINFVINQAKAITSLRGAGVGVGLLLILGLMLWGTQTTIMDATSRIGAENIRIWQKQKTTGNNYLKFMWLQIGFGLLVIALGFTQPRELITLSAIINAGAMAVNGALMLKLNKSLPLDTQPSRWRKIGVSGAVLICGGLLAVTILGG